VNIGAATNGAVARESKVALGLAIVITCLVCGCAFSAPTPTAVDCRTLPDARDTLVQAWHQYQPDQPMPFSIPVRSHLFAFQSLLLSAGMYDDPPSDPVSVYAQYAPLFVRDFGMSRNPGLQNALAKLDESLLKQREHPEQDLGDNCGLILAQRMLRADPVGVSTDWVLQAITWGFAPTFQESIRLMVQEYARACSAEPDTANAPELVLACTSRRVGY
jgi:hypothetical protein